MPLWLLQFVNELTMVVATTCDCTSLEQMCMSVLTSVFTQSSSVETFLVSSVLSSQYVSSPSTSTFTTSKGVVVFSHMSDEPCHVFHVPRPI